MSQPLSEYLRNKEIRTNLRYLYNAITGQRGYVLSTGVLVSEGMINEMYPLSDGKLLLWSHIQKGENPDGTHVK